MDERTDNADSCIAILTENFFAFNGEFYSYLYTTAIVTFQGPTDDLQITQKPWKELRRLRQKMEK